MEPNNILEQIVFALKKVNDNIVDLSEEVVALREDMAYLKSILTPLPEAAPEKKAAKPKQQ